MNLMYIHVFNHYSFEFGFATLFAGLSLVYFVLGLFVLKMKLKTNKIEKNKTL